MRKFAQFIVDKRHFIFILFLGIMVFCVWGMQQVEIEYDINSYLPQNTDTKQAIDIMEKEFTTYGTSTIMVKNISYSKAKALHGEIEQFDGVKSFTFNNTTDYYKDSCALFEITYDGDEDDEKCVDAYNGVLKLLEGYDISVSVSLVDNYADELQKDVNNVLLLAIAVIVLVLLFTSESFAEVIVFLAVFGVAALLNMGTNFFLGKISFISNSVCVILQLALAIDYAIILSHRVTEEKQLNGGNAHDALIDALAKAIPEICGSSLTTIAGLLALCTMALGLGKDLGIVLAKSIVCSMFAVFFFMPVVLGAFGKLIDKTRHRNLVPSIRFLAKGVVKARYPIIVLFLVAAIGGTVLSFNVDYAYSSNSIDTSRPSATQQAIADIEEVFGKSNQFVVLVPGNDYEKQRELIKIIESHDEIQNSLGICNVEITLNSEKVYLTEQMNYKRISALLSMDENTTDAIMGAYAWFSQSTVEDSTTELAVYQADKEHYTASLLELCDCAFSHDDFISALLNNNKDYLDKYGDLKETVQDAEAQLVGTNYSRIIFDMDLPLEGKETFAFIDTLLTEVKGFYPGTIFAGNSMNAYDMNDSFSGDNIKVSLISIIAVFIILMFSFKSWGIPIPLVLTIQGAIFINFAIYPLIGSNLFFFVYLIISAIQMGATIDYAIVTSSRYIELRNETSAKEAIVEAVNGAFPTILTSGTIMTVAGFLIGGIVKDPLIATMGTCLGRGVIISILGVLIVVPALLVVLDKPLQKTKFKTYSGKKVNLSKLTVKRIKTLIKEIDAEEQQEVAIVTENNPENKKRKRRNNRNKKKETE